MQGGPSLLNPACPAPACTAQRRAHHENTEKRSAPATALCDGSLVSCLVHSAMAFQRFLSRPSLRPLSTASWKRGRDADRFANMAISEDLRTRAAYKLAAMNSGARHFLRQGSCVVDLGAAPGGWALVAADAVRLDASRADARVWGRASRVRDEPPPPVRRTAGGQQRQRKFGEVSACVRAMVWEALLAFGEDARFV